MKLESVNLPSDLNSVVLISLHFIIIDLKRLSNHLLLTGYKLVL